MTATYIKLKKAFKNDVKPAWVVGDEVYGCHALRSWLEQQEQPYVLAVASNYPKSVYLFWVSHAEDEC